VTSRDGRAFSPGALASVVTSGDAGGQTTAGRGEVWIRPIPPILTFTVDDQALVSSRTTAVVTGTYTCGPLDFSQGGGGVVDLTVQQGSVSGSGSVDTAVCDGTPQAWSATVTAHAGRFRRGAALGLASGYVCGDALPDVYTCQTTGQIEQSLTLRR
jgi:hypothetical protein